MFGWFRRNIRKVEVLGVGVEFHPPTDDDAGAPAPSTLAAAEPSKAISPPVVPPPTPPKPPTPPPAFRPDQCIGRWHWRLDGSATVIDLCADGTWTAKSDEGVGLFGNVTEFRGIWHVQGNRLRIFQTHYWAVALWKRHESHTWLDEVIRRATGTVIELADGSCFRMAE